MPDSKSNEGYIKDVSLAYHSGHLDKARLINQQLLQRKGFDPESIILVATTCREQGDLPFSIQLLKEATQAIPADARLYSELARSLHSAGELEAAIHSTQTALQLGTDSESLHYFYLGIMFQELGLEQDAASNYEAAIRIDPECAMAHNNLGNIHRNQEQLEKAALSYRQAVKFSPNLAIAHYNLGCVLGLQGSTDEAYDCYMRALALEPDFPVALMNLGTILKDQGRIMEALDAYTRADQLDPANIDIQNNRLYTLNFSDELSPEDIYEEHRTFESGLPGFPDNKPDNYCNDREPSRTLRIGYVSPDLRDHSILFFIAPVLSNHNKKNFKTYAYYNNTVSDAGTDHLKTLVDEWRDIANLTDESVISLVKEDRIDILVDLAGHTAHNRLTVFAQKPAPVQATWMGYPNTTGLTAIDYRIVDNYTDPAGLNEHLHSEELIRLPTIFSVYSAPPQSPPAGVPPSEETGKITFGSFNNVAKISSTVISVWAKVLHAVPGSCLVLKYKGMEQTTAKDRLYSEFSSRGISRDRLVFIGRDDNRDSHLQHYSRIDIALDTYPYNGTTTTCEALWMGVPVITLKGDRHASRVACSILSNLGMPDCIASNDDEFVKIAARLAGDSNQLKKLRTGLRARLSSSPVMNAGQFTADLEQAYRTMWQRWCDQPDGS